MQTSLIMCITVALFVQPVSVSICSFTIEISKWKRSYLLSNGKTKAKSQQEKQNYKNLFFKLSWWEICTMMELTMLPCVVGFSFFFFSLKSIPFVAISGNILCISLFSRIFEPIKRKQRVHLRVGGALSIVSLSRILHSLHLLLSFFLSLAPLPLSFFSSFSVVFCFAWINRHYCESLCEMVFYINARS